MILRKKAKYIFWAVVYAIGQFYLTVYIFGVAGGNTLMATIGNMSIVMFLVALEKMETYWQYKLNNKYKDPEKKRGIFIRIALSYLNGSSAKSSLYFFYIVITICSALMAAGTTLFEGFTINGFPFSDYLQSVRYGILLLVAADKFLDQILKDIKTAETITSTENSEG